MAYQLFVSQLLKSSGQLIKCDTGQQLSLYILLCLMYSPKLRRDISLPTPVRSWSVNHALERADSFDTALADLMAPLRRLSAVGALAIRI